MPGSWLKLRCLSPPLNCSPLHRLLNPTPTSTALYLILCANSITPSTFILLHTTSGHSSPSLLSWSSSSFGLAPISIGTWPSPHRAQLFGSDRQMASLRRRRDLPRRGGMRETRVAEPWKNGGHVRQVPWGDEETTDVDWAGRDHGAGIASSKNV